MNQSEESEWIPEIYHYQADIYLLKVYIRNTKANCKICLKSTIKTPERLHWRVTYLRPCASVIAG